VNKELYEKMWKHEDYRKVAPGEHYVYRFVEWAKPPEDSRIIDFGCGTGRGALLLQILTTSHILALDFASNCMDKNVKALGLVTFRQHDLREPLQENIHDFGYCTDVLEHIAPEDVETVLRNIFVSARRVFLAISTVPDHFGPAVAGEPLHLTVKPHAWWKATLENIGVRIDREQEGEGVAFFYGSIYATGKDYSEVTGLNVSMDRIRDNIRANMRAGLTDICPHQVQETKVYLLAGGPSLADHEQEIIELGKSGALFVTVNGTYKWLIERGIKPAAQVMIDAREFNARFVEPVIDSCKYIFSSQAAKEAVAKVPPSQGFIFHSGETEQVKECFDEFCKETGTNRSWFPVYGGTTVIGRALVCLAMLGFRNVEVFGWDSCLRMQKWRLRSPDGSWKQHGVDGYILEYGTEQEAQEVRDYLLNDYAEDSKVEGVFSHHAYAQAENDSDHIVPIHIGGKEFRCHPWMVVQAHEFPKIIRYILGPIPDFNLCVRGDGLIAHMLNHAALLAGKD
jgi:trans-aconitate methyltransferase